MQHSKTRPFLPSSHGQALYRGILGCSAWVGGALMGLGMAQSIDAAEIKNKTCIDYYTVGDVSCRNASSSSTIPSQNESKAVSVAPQQAKSAVDLYMDNYGKPPRAFVEFYLNPTAENAQKWVAEYQNMIAKSGQLSKAWAEADQLYRQQNPSAYQNIPPVNPALPQAAEAPSQPVVAPPTTRPVLVQPSSNLGGVSSQLQPGGEVAGGIRQKRVALTYYFSQTCPYCARMTPYLAILSKELESKLAFTCVDVTPLGPQNQPNEAYITSKLPCQWRLPEEGEVAAKQVNQTPTLWIEKEGEAPVRISGYVPLTQLRSYFY